MIYIVTENKIITYEKNILARTGDLINVSNIMKDGKKNGSLVTNLITGFQCTILSENAIDKIIKDCKEITYEEYLRRIFAIENIKRAIIEAVKKANEEKNVEMAQSKSKEKVEEINDGNKDNTSK